MRKEQPDEQMIKLMKRLYPVYRSITGEGVRKTLDIIGEEIKLERYEVKSGKKVFDWEVPKEWKIKDAYVKDERGRKIIDFKRNFLHVAGYSVPVNKQLRLGELKKHLCSLPNRPGWVPYRTLYYENDWGFCIEDSVLKSLKDGKYEVLIDSELKRGKLDYAEHVIKGKTDREIIIFTHVCHPAMCNDGLSGIAVSVALAKKLEGLKNKYTYRFVYAPTTIGSIAWLYMNRKRIGKIYLGLVVTNVGDRGPLTYKRTKRGNSDLDKSMELSLRDCGMKYRVMEFSPYGYDERQFSSPGFNLDFGCFTRSMYGEYKEYHTSADDFKVVKEKYLRQSLEVIFNCIWTVENDARYMNLKPYGEPQLGKRGLYRAMNTLGTGEREAQMAMLWVLNMSDGKCSLVGIAQRSQVPFELLFRVVAALKEKGLLKEEER